MPRTLQDKIALVTGGAQGLGEAICQRLAAEGAHVVVADLNLDGAQQVAADIAAQTDRRSLAIKVNITDEADVAAAVQRTVAEFGRLDIAVSNAGILIAEAVDEFPADKWRAVIDVNLTGYFLLAKHAAQVMKAQRSGVILQINSKSGKKGSFKNSAYAASKFGGIGLTQSIALELAEYGVRCNAICPGTIESPSLDDRIATLAKQSGEPLEKVRQAFVDRQPIGRLGKAREIAMLAVYLASDESSYTTGQIHLADGGFAL